ncbi:hypothetical protein B0H11DRAFT_2066922, partial [Mycena galericulata]
KVRSLHMFTQFVFLLIHIRNHSASLDPISLSQVHYSSYCSYPSPFLLSNVASLPPSRLDSEFATANLAPTIFASMATLVSGFSLPRLLSRGRTRFGRCPS